MSDKKWWACKDREGWCRLYGGSEKPSINERGDFDFRNQLFHDAGRDANVSMAAMACRNLNPGECRELTRFDPVLGIVEYAQEPMSLKEAVKRYIDDNPFTAGCTRMEKGQREKGSFADLVRAYVREVEARK